MSGNFKIICELCSPLCKEAPYLDALLYNELIFKQGLCKQGEKLNRGSSIDKIKEIRMPLRSVRFNDIPIYFCSNSIYICDYEFREDFTYHIEPELAFLLTDKERKSISGSSGIYKDRRLPIRLKLVNKIVWFCCGTKNSVLEILQNIKSIGSLRKQGFGVVSEWQAQDIENDYSFYIEKDNKKILMKSVPEDLVDKNTIGYSIGYGAFSPPYWHPKRFTNIAYPI
jgi:hypothetical protein